MIPYYPYKVLGLNPSSSIEDIKNNYKRKLMECHPDVNSSPDAERQVMLLNNAYNFLKRYHNTNNMIANVKGSDNNFSPNRTKYFVVTVDLLDVIQEKNILIEVPIENFCEVCGASGKITSQEASFCYDCNGNGSIQSSYGVMRTQKKCSSCNGTGANKNVSCKKCLGHGVYKTYFTESYTLSKTTMSGFQEEFEPIIGDFEERYNYSSMLISFQIRDENSPKIKLDDYQNLIFNYDLDALTSIIGGKARIRDIGIFVNFKELTQNGHIIKIPSERNKLGRPIKLIINIVQSNLLKHEDIIKIRESIK